MKRFSLQVFAPVFFVSFALSCVVSSDAAPEVIAWGGNSGQTRVPANATNVMAIAGGDFHGLALRRDGTVIAWGSDLWQGGRDANTNVPPGLTNVVGIGAGAGYSLALHNDRSLTLWGAIYGTGQMTTTIPVEATNVVELARGTGVMHALVLRGDGTVVDWGDKQYGLTNVPSSARHIVSVAGGSWHSLALRADGRVVAWGHNAYGQTNVPVSATNIVAIAAGEQVSAGLRSDGTLLVWGNGSSPSYPDPFALNDVIDLVGGFRPFSSTPLIYLRANGRIQSPTSPPLSATNVVSIAGMSDAGIVLMGNGAPVFTGHPVDRTVVAGASAYFRKLATGAFPLSYQWSFNGTNIPGATNTVLVVTNAGISHAGGYSVTASNAFGVTTSSNMLLTVLPLEVTLDPRNQVTYWGNTIVFQSAAEGPDVQYQWLFNGDMIAGATNANLILTNVPGSAEGSYSVVISNELGIATSSAAKLTLYPIQMTGFLTNATLFRGATARLGVKAHSSQPISYQWQFNGNPLPSENTDTLILTNLQHYQSGLYSVVLSNSLGFTNSVASLRATDIAGWNNGGTVATTIPADLTNVVAVATENGLNTFAVFEDGSVKGWGSGGFNRLNIPSDLTNAISIAVGGYHALALTSNGTVVGWGADTAETGIFPNWGQSQIPSGLSNVVAVAAGGEYSLALRNDGTVIAWGRNEKGQTNVPAGLTDVVAISARERHSLALKADGTVAAWGANLYGVTNVPTGLSDVIAIASGYNHCLALRSDGGLLGWGDSPYAGVPVGISNVVAIACGSYHSLALQADGVPVMWGYGGTKVNLPDGLTNIVQLSAGGSAAFGVVGNDRPVTAAAAMNPLLGTNGFSIAIPSQSGRVFRLEYKSSLTDDDWTPLPLVAGTGGMLTLRDITATNDSPRYYRIRRW